MRLAQFLHFVMFLALFAFGFAASLGTLYLLRFASRRWRLDLRAPQRGTARSCRDKPRVFSKQRFCQRRLSFDCLGGRRLTAVRRLKLSNPRDVPAAFEIGR